MKTTIGIFFVMVFGVFVLTPKMPNPYPPIEVIRQSEAIPFKESKIDHTIVKIENLLITNSIELEHQKDSLKSN